MLKLVKCKKQRRNGQPRERIQNNFELDSEVENDSNIKGEWLSTSSIMKSRFEQYFSEIQTTPHFLLKWVLLCG